LDLHDNDFHKLSTDEVYKKHKTDPKNGLTSAQVTELRNKFGKNELVAEEEKSLFEKIME
jgi:magnesium-transporting ATPase (P-type)